MINAKVVYEFIQDACPDMPDADFDQVIRRVAWSFGVTKDELLRTYPDAKRYFYRGMTRWWMLPDDVAEWILDGGSSLNRTGTCNSCFGSANEA